VSLDAIARRARVGVATAYRNLLTKDAIIEAIYWAEVEHLAKAAPDLLASMPAAEALHQWMHRSVDYVAAKTGLASDIQETLEISTTAPAPFFLLPCYNAAIS
jgi:AcrR family transcriptional regulator